VKIAVVGSAAHCVKAPFGDPSWEIWGCNVPGLPRWDRWFDLHEDAIIDSHPDHRAWLTSQDKPVFTQTNYPLKAMLAKYGTWFFTSTISFMLAMALEENPEEIGLYGVDLADATEYKFQRPGCRFFVQTALLRGIAVSGPPEAEVFMPGKLYGFGKPHPMAHKVEARTAELVGRQQELVTRKDQLTMTLASLKGALDITVPKDKLPAMITDIQAQIVQADRDIILYEGAVQDQNHIRLNWLGD
jgi:hypothetical protein